jgi:hypothetical protein
VLLFPAGFLFEKSAFSLFPLFPRASFSCRVPNQKIRLFSFSAYFFFLPGSCLKNPPFPFFRFFRVLLFPASFLFKKSAFSLFPPFPRASFSYQRFDI